MKLLLNSLRRFVMSYMKLWYYGAEVLFNKPNNDISRDAYTYHQTSQIKMITIVFAILTVLEGGLLHFLVQFWNETIAWVTTLIHVHVLLYLTESVPMKSSFGKTRYITSVVFRADDSEEMVSRIKNLRQNVEAK
ncbi:hypothetical protein [Virgibacillus pantothenticus]|uniref:hypothetical protein n=1 Tax=Virgibacillus pantothenticus TaxID=1473 RepID=UPI001BB0358C|nr:hypothetical protein [Virgibacillus pantothenticus]